MFMIVSLLVLLGFAGLLILPAFRRRLAEELKALSDSLLLWFFRATSRFGRELTKDGVEEQRMWREQRLRNLRGLALRSQETIGRTRSAVGKNEEQSKDQR
jgi:hypothetical protein